ncbi:unnamed protein product, partial [Meganyctiphanes norvegica]
MDNYHITWLLMTLGLLLTSLPIQGKCMDEGGTVFSYEGISYCAKRKCASWHKTRDWCERIGMVIAQPSDPNGLASHINSINMTCYYWVGGRGNNYNQVWLNGTVLSNSNPYWDAVHDHPNVGNDTCMVIQACNDFIENTLQTRFCHECGYRLCQAPGDEGWVDRALDSVDGSIIGVVIGGLILIVIIIVVATYIYCKAKTIRQNHYNIHHHQSSKNQGIIEPTSIRELGHIGPAATHYDTSYSNNP